MKSAAIQRRIRQHLEIERFEQRRGERVRKQARKHARTAAHDGGQRRAETGRIGQRRDRSWLDVPVPRVLNLSTAKEDTCNFFSEVCTLVRRRHRVRLDFDATEQISPEALIYLLGQISRLQSEHGSQVLTGTYPKLKRVERLLEESGFFAALGVKRRGAVTRPSRSTRYIKCKTDTKPAGAEIPKLRDELLRDDLKMPVPVAKKVFRALTEAMVNVNHHAYLGKSIRNPEVFGQWWLAAQLSVRNNYFTLTFYDVGVGIPTTLPRLHTWEKIRGVLSLLPGISPDDGQMIRAAVELGRSRTSEDNRGKGLLDLLKLIDQVGGGTLTIFSRSGSYQYGHGKESHSNDQNFVEGTLIKWELPLSLAIVNLPDIPDDDPDV